MKKRRIIVTGAAGFIGWHLSEHLRRDDAVLTVDREVLPEPRPTHILGDLNQATTLDMMVAFHPDVVVHLAADAAIGSTVNGTALQCGLDDNIRATIGVLDVAVAAGASIVLASSAALYSLPQSSWAPIAAPYRSWYGVTKLVCEELVRLYREAHHVPYAICRFSNVYGPQFKRKGVTGAFLSALLAGVPPVIDGDGSQERDFIHVDDVLRLIGVLCHSELDERLINVSTGVQISVADLWSMMSDEAMQQGLSPLPPQFRPHLPGGVPSCDMPPAVHARVGLAEGVRRLLAVAQGRRPGLPRG